MDNHKCGLIKKNIYGKIQLYLKASLIKMIQRVFLIYPLYSISDI